MKASELRKILIDRLTEKKAQATAYDHPAINGKFKNGYLRGITDALIILGDLKDELEDESE